VLACLLACSAIFPVHVDHVFHRRNHLSHYGYSSSTRPLPTPLSHSHVPRQFRSPTMTIQEIPLPHDLEVCQMGTPGYGIFSNLEQSIYRCKREGVPYASGTWGYTGK
jgi:hypothetical protein